MCEFISVSVNPDCDKKLKIWAAGNFTSHSETAKIHRLKPDTYREVEWTKEDDGASLVVRTIPKEDHEPNWYKACILAEFPTRTDLISWCLENNLTVGSHLDLGGTKITKLPDNLAVGGSLDLRDTKITDDVIPNHLKNKVIR